METRTMVLTIWIGTLPVFGVPILFNKVYKVDETWAGIAGVRPTMDAEFEVIKEDKADAMSVGSNA